MIAPQRQSTGESRARLRTSGADRAAQLGGRGSSPLSSVEERLQLPIPLVYEAATNPDAWSLLLHDLAEHLCSTACALSAYNFGLHEGTIYSAWGYDPDYVRSYVDYYAPLNVWLQEEGRYRPTGAISIGQHIDQDRRRQEVERVSGLVPFHLEQAEATVKPDCLFEVRQRRRETRDLVQPERCVRRRRMAAR
jgi:hypothetical protein